MEASNYLFQLESAFKSYGIQISQDHFLLLSESDGAIINNFGKWVLTGQLIAIPITADFVRDLNVLIKFQLLVRNRFHCAIVPEEVKSGNPETFSKFSNHFGSLTIKVIARRGNELKIQREYESASWYNPARYPYIPMNWFVEDATYITLFNLRSFLAFTWGFSSLLLFYLAVKLRIIFCGFLKLES